MVLFLSRLRFSRDPFEDAIVTVNFRISLLFELNPTKSYWAGSRALEN